MHEVKGLSKMKKIRKSLIYIVSAFSAVVAIGMFWLSEEKTGDVKITQAVNEEKQANVVDNGANMKYMVKEYYGNIGVYIFAEDEYVLISIKDFDVSKLPEADILALRDGIFLESQEDMLQILEDYTS